jgi:hypothetical protein
VSEEYQAPEHGWTCFHCGETFTTVGSAGDHFGNHPGALPGCMERVRLGEERGLLMSLRKAEARIAELLSDIHNESSYSAGFYAALGCSIQSFKAFKHCRSLQDVFNLYDSMEGRALSAEEKLAKNSSEVQK